MMGISGGNTLDYKREALCAMVAEHPHLEEVTIAPDPEAETNSLIPLDTFVRRVRCLRLTYPMRQHDHPSAARERGTLDSPLRHCHCGAILAMCRQT